MKGYIVDYTVAGRYKQMYLLADDGPDTAQRLARRLEYQGVTVNTITVIDDVESLADVEDAAQGPCSISQVLVFEEVCA